LSQGERPQREEEDDMTRTIGNPFQWALEGVGGLGAGMGQAVRGLQGTEAAPPAIRTIDMEDVREALRRGVDDALAFRSDVLLAVAMYPVIGLFLAGFAFRAPLMPLIFPVISGFALVGPLAAVGLYEMSRRRAAGESVGWGAAFGVLARPSLSALVVLGAALLTLFLAWIGAAAVIHAATLGPEPPASLAAFAADVTGTAAGWTMIAVGCATGFLFAALVLAFSVISFPLLVDREVGVMTAAVTSVRFALANPRPVAAWGAIVAIGLVLGTLPLFLGLIVVLPVLGHATWHLYRAGIAPR
jgi:uncharacterized membrane protein